MHELTCVDTHTASTPLIRLGKLSEETGCTVAVKAEFLNPGGSVKDRAALFLIKDAEERGTSALRMCGLWCIYMHFHMCMSEAAHVRCPLLYTFVQPSSQGWVSRCPLLHVHVHTFFLSGLWLGGLLNQFYSLQYILYNLQYILYSLQYILYNLQYIFYSLQYILYNLQYIFYSLQYILYSPQYMLFSLQYILYNLQYILYSCIRVCDDAGLVQPGGTVVEGTAGNTGIGLAHICKALGYKCVIYMPNTQSQVRGQRSKVKGHRSEACITQLVEC